MREFFINWAQRLITALVVFAGVGMLMVGLAQIFSGMGDSVWTGILFILAGLALLIIMCGVVCAAFGTYRNTQDTKRMLAEVLDR